MTHERFKKYTRKTTLRPSNRGSIETTECKWCGKVISNGHIIRYYCNPTCGRKSIYFKNNSLENQKNVHVDHEQTYDVFRKYMIEMIKTQPIIYYKDWEVYARHNSIPDEIMEMILFNIPLPRPNDTGYGLPKIKITDRKKLEKEILA